MRNETVKSSFEGTGFVSEQEFLFYDQPIRVVVKCSEDGEVEPWFVASDVCKVLGIVNARDAVRTLDEDERGSTPLRDIIQRVNPNTNIIRESGLYMLIMRSRKPAARPFQQWVTKTLLPQIRKAGLLYSNLLTAERLLELVEGLPRPVVYVAEADGRVKVGTTGNLPLRLKAIKTYSPAVELSFSVDGGFSLEKTAHKALQKWNVGGEWFEDCPECRAELERVLGVTDDCN